MASSAKFLEEALSTDVDESAVSAIVGSLENQLGTPSSVVSCQQISSTNVNQNHLHSDLSNGGSAPAQKHGTANGQADNMSIILNSESNKGITSNNHQLGNIAQTITNSTVQGVVCSASFANQVPSNVGIVQSSTANLTKTQDGLKTVFSTVQSAVSTASSPRVATYPLQNVNSLPNGNINVTSIPANNVLSVSNSNIQGMVSQTFTQSNSSYHKITPVGTEQNKQPGTAVIIKSNACNNISTGVSSQMTGAITLSQSQLNNTVTLAKPTTASGAQTIVGNAPILSNIQLVNISNALRTATPAQTGNKTTASPRLMFPQVVRPGGATATGQIALQALQGLQNAQGGHLLLKTESGHFQLVRLHPPASTTVTQNSTATALPAGSYRLTVPVCCVAQTSTTTSTVQTVTTQSAIPVPSTPPVQRAVDNSKEKCRKFLTNLLELSSREPRAVERNVSTLIQELIDSKVEPEEFCDRLERLLNASPQPCLIGFLKKSLPGLRAAMIAKEMSIDGIRAPPGPSQPPTVVLAAPAAAVVQAQIQNNQVRPVQIGSMQQMRVVPQTTIATGTRPQQQIQHRIITPVRLQTATTGTTGALSGMKVVTTPTMPTVATTVRIQSPLPTSAPDTASTTSATVQLVPSSSAGATIVSANATPTTTPIRVTTPRQALVKTMSIKTTTTTSPVTVRASASTASTAKSGAGSGTKTNFVSKSPMLAGIGKQTSSSQSKTAAKERERKAAAATASSAAAAATPVTALAGGYVGDDDVNDVAAMAGVNLAEETQKILGPSEFVGTQIRSCKDETFLHTHPLTMRIIQIVTKHGLEEPSSEVVALVSHAAQERLKNIVEKLNVVAEHRVDFNKADRNYEISHDIRGQLRFLEELDKVERKRHDEMERELLLRAAKSRSKSEDPEQVKLKAKAKELQRAEMEELRQREANLTALQAIGPRKKIKLDSNDGSSTLTSVAGSSTNAGANRLSLANRPRLKRVTVRDLLYVMEKEKHISRSPFLYKSYLK